MSKRDLTSVIVPCFNQAEFLGEALESIFAQTYPHYEVIVVDDGSTDGTARVAESFERVRCLRQRNRGLAAARNAGFKASTGGYVVFLDSDDRLLPDALETGVVCLDANPECAFSYGHVKLIATDGSPLPTPHQAGIEDDHYLSLLRRNYIWTTGAVMYRRTAFESVGGFNTLVSASADFDLNARIARVFPICCCERVVVEYRRHDQAMSRDYAVMLQAAVTARRLHRKLIKGRTLHEEALEAGIRHSQEDYGEKLIRRVRSRMQEHECGEAIRGLLAILRYYPQGLIKRARRKLYQVGLNVQH
jgi:glycosyltransferase involved in cell wall biosynthesis